MGPMKLVFMLFVALAYSSISSGSTFPLRILPGFPHEKELNDAIVLRFLESILADVKEPPSGTDNELTTVVNVTDATVQITDTVKFAFNFEARGMKTQKLYSCSLTFIPRPWVKLDEVQDYQCQLLTSNALRSLASENEQELSSYYGKHACPGCPLEHDAQDPLVQQFLESSLTTVKAPPKGTDNELTTLVKLIRVTSQVVSGIKYTYDFKARGVKTHKLYNCRIVVLSRSWAEGDVVQDYHCEQHSSNLLQRSLASENEQELSSYYGKQACPGCPLEHDAQDPFVQQFLESALTTVKAPPKGTDNELTTLIKLTRVTSQVVSGIKYTYDFEARGVKTHKLYNCRIVVLSRPWAEGETVQDFQCHHPISNLVQSSSQLTENNQLLTSENALPGSPQEEDLNDPFVQQFLGSTLTQVKAPPKGTENELTTLVKVTKVTSQVVSGVKYTYNFVARGVKTHNLYNCSLTVVSQPWAGGDLVQDYQCQHNL